MEDPSAIKVSQSWVYACDGERRRGVAFFIDDSHLLTCAHVVAKCLGPSFDASVDDCEGKPVTCEIPTNGAPQTFNTTVLVYKPALMPGQGTPAEQAVSDVAVLRIDPEKPLPVKPDPYKFSEHRMNDQVVLVGVATVEDGNVAVSIGRVVKAVDDGRIYVKIDPSDGARPGYSGGPVESLEGGETVFGMVQQAPGHGGDAKFIPSHLIREALSGRFTIDVAARGRKSSVQSNTSDRGEFIYTLLTRKDRNDQERELSKAIADSFDTRAQAFKISVALLPTPAESCPDIFRNRLASNRFAQARDWGGRPTWVRDWAAPVLDLTGNSNPLESHLKNVLSDKLGLPADEPGRLPAESGVRARLIRRLALVPVHVKIDPWSIERGAVQLADEVGRWAEAQATAPQRPFCLLLFLMQEHSRFLAPLMWLFDLEKKIGSRLSPIERAFVRWLPPLRPLKANLDLDEWIDNTSRLLRQEGHEPTAIKTRVLEKAYRGQRDKDVTFYQWFCLLDRHEQEIFREH